MYVSTTSLYLAFTIYHFPPADYEQQRLHLLHKHGIDLEDTNGIADGTKTKRMNRRDVELLMGGGEGQGGVFTWRDKNRRKVCSFMPPCPMPHSSFFLTAILFAQLAYSVYVARPSKF